MIVANDVPRHPLNFHEKENIWQKSLSLKVSTPTFCISIWFPGVCSKFFAPELTHIKD